MDPLASNEYRHEDSCISDKLGSYIWHREVSMERERLV